MPILNIARMFGSLPGFGDSYGRINQTVIRIENGMLCFTQRFYSRRK